jgi:hypothetical protein
MTFVHFADKDSHTLIETLKILPLLERIRIESDQNTGVKDSAIFFKLFLDLLYEGSSPDGTEAFADGL